MQDKSNGVTDIDINDLDEDFGSLMNYIYSIVGDGVQFYLKEIPEGFQSPSIFMRPPHNIDFNDTVSTYKVNYLIPIKVFHLDNIKSYALAKKIADDIRFNRYRIPIIDTDGNPTGKLFRINTSLEINQVDHGINELVVNWSSRYWFKRPVYSKMGGLKLNFTVKE